jgi:photosystem II core protein PsbZ
MNITLVFQFALLALILLSILLTVAVPVLLTSAESWNENKRYILTGSAAWAVLVLTVGILNSLVV